MKTFSSLLISLMLIFVTHSGAQSLSKNTDSSPKSKIAQIPFELFNNLIFIRVSIDDSLPFPLLLDSGVSNTVIDSSVAKKLNLRSFASGEATGAGENTESVQVFKDIKIRVGEVNFVPPVLVAANFSQGSSAAIGRQMSGALGTDFLREYVVEVDYQKQILSLYDPKTYEYKGKGKTVPLQMIDDLPHLSAEFNMEKSKPAIEGLFLLDSGMTGAISFNKSFHNESNLLSQTSRKITSSSVGLGGEINEFTARLSSINLGKIQIHQPIASFSQAQSGATAKENRAGIIGGQILNRFRVVFDYQRNRLILESNSRLSEPFETDMSGIKFKYEGENFNVFRVISVLRDSPASRAGLIENDVITVINEKKIETLTADDVRKIFRQKNKIIKLTFSRNGEQKSTKLKTQRLI